MTRFDYLVTMNPWTIDTMQARLQELAGPDVDPGDERTLTRHRILDAAAEQFARFGYRRTNISDIARAAGVGKGTIYLYFDSKKTLLIAAVAREKMAMIPEMAVIQQSPPETQLEQYLRMAIRFSMTAPVTSAIMRGDHELEAIIKEMDMAQMSQDIESALGLFGQMIAGVAPHLSTSQQRTLAQLVHIIPPLTSHLVDKVRRDHLSVDDVVEHLAGVMTRGIQHTDPE